MGPTVWRAYSARGLSTPVKRHMTTSTVALPDHFWFEKFLCMYVRAHAYMHSFFEGARLLLSSHECYTFCQ